jgi:hypothetical protein
MQRWTFAHADGKSITVGARQERAAPNTTRKRKSPAISAGDLVDYSTLRRNSERGAGGD